MSREQPILRVARESADLEALLRFYIDGLGMRVLSRFADHPGGYDGLIVGWPQGPYHLEFTRRRGVLARRGGAEDLLVFYVPEPKAWQARVAQMTAAGWSPVAPANPWWTKAAVTFEDPDGYRVVLACADWQR